MEKTSKFALGYASAPCAWFWTPRQVLVAVGCHRVFCAHTGACCGITTAEQDRVKALERGARKLRRASKMLKRAGAF